MKKRRRLQKYVLLKRITISKHSRLLSQWIIVTTFPMITTLSGAPQPCHISAPTTRINVQLNHLPLAQIMLITQKPHHSHHTEATPAASTSARTSVPPRSPSAKSKPTLITIGICVLKQVTKQKRAQIKLVTSIRKQMVTMFALIAPKKHSTIMVRGSAIKNVLLDTFSQILFKCVGMIVRNQITIVMKQIITLHALPKLR